MSSALTIGRLQLGPPSGAIQELMGDPVGQIGSAIVPAARVPLQVTLDLNTILSGAATLAQAQTLRRQLRSALNNGPLKLQMFLYVQYGDDVEQNGWLVPSPMTLASPDGTAWKAVGLWQSSSATWFLAGKRWSMKEARSVLMKDLRSGAFDRDYLGWIRSTDFALLPALALTYLPHGASAITDNVTDAVVVCASMPSGRDGGVCKVATGVADLTAVSFNRAESALNVSDVIAYDRRGNFGPFMTGPTNWAPNPNFEHDAVGAAPAGYELPSNLSTNLVSNSWADTGSQSLHLVSTTTGGNSAQLRLAGPAGGTTGAAGAFAIKPGQTVAARRRVKVNSVSGGWLMTWRFRQTDLAGVAFADSNGPSVAPIAGQVQDVISLQTMGTNFPDMLLYVYIDCVCTSPGTLDISIDNVGLYIDTAGVTPTQVDADVSPGYIWSGTPGDSPSVVSYDSASGLTDPQTAYGWEEVYGPDYPWSWMDGANDCVVIENGLVRVRYDGTHTPGFRVDMWNGSSYVEQGKMTVQRAGDVAGDCDTWVSAGLHEYTPDRVVTLQVLANSADVYSHERIYITLQRGEQRVRFECYPSPGSAVRSDVSFYWTPALVDGLVDLNVSAAKIDSQGSGNWTPGGVGSAVYRSTAGTGTGPGQSGGILGAAQLGALSFAASENWVSILRCPLMFAGVGAYQTTLAVIQAASANAKVWGGDTRAYGVAANAFQISSGNQAGYLQVQLAFTPTVAQQVMEAENMTRGAGTSIAVDASASGTGSNITTATRTTDANPHISQANWPNGVLAVYRVFAKAKVSANFASMYAAAPNFPTSAQSNFLATAADDATVGTVAWTSPSNVVSNNVATPATAALNAADVSHYLKATNFLLSVPANATILGIQPTIYRFATTNTTIEDASVKLVKAGVIVGTEHASANIWQTGTPQSASYGSPSDLWGTTWTPADISDVGFGIALAATAIGGSDTAKIYWATIAVTYRVNGSITTVSALVNSWYDLGEVPSGGTLDIHGWMSGGAGTFSLDRVEAVLVEDRTRAGAVHAGARDHGQAALYDSRTIGALAVR